VQTKSGYHHFVQQIGNRKKLKNNKMGKNLSIATISLLLVLASTKAQQALTKAWKASCVVAGSKVVISAGVYKLGLVTLLGPCKGAIEFNLQGTLQAPLDVASLNGKDGWVVFERIDGLTVSGGGNIRFNYVTNSKVQDITSKDSKFFHINLLECKKLQFQHVTISAPTDSANTDGIHIGRSSQITITNANIGTGDDCISVGDGAQDITVNQVTCGPGHGISIGSLGRYQNEEPVSRIRVTSATLSNTDNGVRIKTWPASTSGVAFDIHFEDVVMNNVANPSPSKVKISNVSFKKIRGTSSTKEV
ncbi:exopolygalacturonase, partial [Quercus suber]